MRALEHWSLDWDMIKKNVVKVHHDEAGQSDRRVVWLLQPPSMLVMTLLLCCTDLIAHSVSLLVHHEGFFCIPSLPHTGQLQGLARSNGMRALNHGVNSSWPRRAIAAYCLPPNDLGAK